jgi:Phosphotransferase enzyme family/NAD dependent epimerase/dehydratase family
VRILVLGGTSFVGRAIVEDALRAGAEVTLFGRGRTGTDLFPGVPRLTGDRDTGDYTALGSTAPGGGRWDAVVDSSGYVPRHVGQAMDALGDRAGRYLFVSSHAVYQREGIGPGSTEDTPRRQPVRDTEELREDTYGPLKVACEDDVTARYGSRATIVRPGKVAGPHDPQDGLTYYVRRAARGGQVALPADPRQPVPPETAPACTRWSGRNGPPSSATRPGPGPRACPPRRWRRRSPTSWPGTATAASPRSTPAASPPARSRRSCRAPGKPLGSRPARGRQWTVASPDDLIRLEGGGRTAVYRRGDVVIRETGPWTPAVHALLRHLEQAGFAAAPRLAGPGLDAHGREVLTFIDGEFTQPGPWSLDGAAALGRLLRDLHRATATFRPPLGAVWFPWHGRDLGGRDAVIGHCDVAPWNIVARGGLPVALIDWETAGPVDPLVELAQLGWLNAKLHDDTVAGLEHLPPAADRARQLAAIVDGYGLTAAQRRGFVAQMIEFAICDTAQEADDAAVTPETTAHPVALWAMAWRARSAAWMIRHRRILETAVNR